MTVASSTVWPEVVAAAIGALTPETVHLIGHFHGWDAVLPPEGLDDLSRRRSDCTGSPRRGMCRTWRR